jgi:hypothetical protein
MENILSIIAGACFTLVCSVIIKDKLKASWRFYNYYFLYIIYLIVIAFGVYCLFQSSTCISNGICWITIGVGVISSIITFISFRSSDIIDTKKIKPKVIKFTQNAKGNEIYLLGGDLNFFGDEIENMDNDEQYKQLKQKNFDKILILCKKPAQEDKILCQRYGKILRDFAAKVELRFYNDNSQDAHIRGRIKWKLTPHIQQALIYERVENNKYRTKEEDITCEDANIGNPYILVWTLLWKYADKLSDEDKRSWINENNN